MHRDPVFKEVAKRESRSCHGCAYRFSTWGIAYCTKGKWTGVKHEKRCEQWTHKGRCDD